MWCTLDRKPQQVPQSQPLPSEMLPHAQRVRERAALLRMEQENKRRRERITADHEQSSDRIAPSAALPSSTAPMSADQKERNRQATDANPSHTRATSAPLGVGRTLETYPNVTPAQAWGAGSSGGAGGGSQVNEGAPDGGGLPPPPGSAASTYMSPAKRPMSTPLHNNKTVTASPNSGAMGVGGKANVPLRAPLPTIQGSESASNSNGSDANENDNEVGDEIGDKQLAKLTEEKLDMIRQQQYTQGGTAQQQQQQQQQINPMKVFWVKFDNSCTSAEDTLRQISHPLFKQKFIELLSSPLDDQLSVVVGLAIRIAVVAASYCMRKTQEGINTGRITLDPLLQGVCSCLLSTLSFVVDFNSRLIQRLERDKVQRNDVKNTNNNSNNTSHDQWLSVLIESSKLIGLVVTLPGEGSLGVGVRDNERVTTGMSVSDKWCLVSLLCTMLQYDGDKTNLLAIQSVRSLGAVISSASVDMFSMLLAQHIPMLLCDCLLNSRLRMRRRSDHHDNEGGGVGAAEDNSMYNDAGEMIDEEEEEVDDVDSSESTSLQELPAYAAHALALLLHTVGPQWVPVASFPLDAIWNRIDRRASQMDTGNMDKASERSALKRRVCLLVADRLVKGRGSRLAALIKLLEAVCQPDALYGRQVTTSVAQSPARSPSPAVPDMSMNLSAQDMMRSAILRILTHLSGFGSSFFCSDLISYRNSVVMSILFDILQIMSPKTSSKPVDTFSQGLAASTLTNLILCSNNLSFSQINSCVQAAGVLISDCEDPRVAAAGAGLLAAVSSIAVSQPPNSISSLSNNDMNNNCIDPTGSNASNNNNRLDDSDGGEGLKNNRIISLSPLQRAQLWKSICKYVFNGPTMSSMHNLLSQAQMGSQITCILGTEFGLRTVGTKDGALGLLAFIAWCASSKTALACCPVANMVAPFMASTGESGTFASLVCKQLLSAVRALLMIQIYIDCINPK